MMSSGGSVVMIVKVGLETGVTRQSGGIASSASRLLIVGVGGKVGARVSMMADGSSDSSTEQKQSREKSQ